MNRICVQQLVVILSLLFLPLTLSAQTYHSGHLFEDEVWSPADNPHVVWAGLTIGTGATLIILPGCYVQFDAEAQFRITVYIHGSLQAIGTLTQRIIFTSSSPNPNPGDWNGFYSTTSDSVIFDYCDISYAGSSGIYVIGDDDNKLIANSTIQHSSSYGIQIAAHTGTPSTVHNASITNCVIRNNAAGGVICRGTSVYYSEPYINDCTIINNGGYPIETSASGVNEITGDMEIYGNATDAILVTANGLTEGRWASFGVPYVIQNASVSIAGGDTLIIDPGNIIRLSGVSTNPASVNVAGTLIAEGTPEARITFTSDNESPAAGDWAGFTFNPGSRDSRLNFCDIFYAGSSSNGSVRVSQGNVNISNSNIQFSLYGGFSISSSRACFDDCVIGECSGPGICLGIDCEVEMNNCEIMDCDDYPIILEAVSVSNITGPLNLHDNAFQGILVVEGDGCRGYWNNYNVPYIIDDDLLVQAGDSLEIAPGCTLRFNGDYLLNAQGSLLAIGSEFEPIVFTSNSETPAPGDWKGIQFNNSFGMSTCRCSDCVIEYAGSSTGCVRLSTSHEVTFANCLVRYSETAGIYVGPNSTPTLINCYIVDNGTHGVYLYNESSGLNGGGAVSEWNDIHSNGLFNVYHNNAAELDLGFMYWGTTDSSSIADGIHLFSGSCNFTPWLNELHDEIFPHSLSDAPTLSFTSQDSTGLRISWHPVQYAAGYKIYSSVDSYAPFEEWGLLAEVTADTTFSLDSHTWPRQFFRVHASFD